MKIFVSFLLIFCTSLSIKATHLMGGEITVQDLGNNNYQVVLIAYRDTVGIPMGQTADFKFTGPQGLTFIQRVNYTSMLSGTLLPMYPYGVEVYFFVDTVQLQTAGVWNISWSNCCRNGAIQNLSNPLQENMHLQTEVEVFSNSTNSSAFFLVPAAIYLPVNTQWQYNPLPFDPDGDSLIWRLDQPLNNVNQNCIGYTDPPSNPSNPFRIDSITGTISWTANTIGNFVVSILVDQYRNGVWIGEIRRDMQLIVVSPTSGYPIWNKLGNMPIGTSNLYSFDLQPNQAFKLEIIVGHSDTTKQVYLGAFSSLLIDANSTASFNTLSMANNQVKGTFLWQPDNSNVSQEPYKVVFRNSDGYLTDDKTVLLNVKNSSIGLKDYNVNLKVFPNPAKEELFIDFTSKTEEIVSMNLFSMTGTNVIQKAKFQVIDGRNIFTLNTDNLKAGTYILQILTSDGDSYLEKILIE